MGQEQAIRDRRSLVISRHNDDRHAAGRTLYQCLTRRRHRFHVGLRLIKQVAGVKDEICAARQSLTNDPMKTVDEVMPPAPSGMPRPPRQIRAEVRIGGVQDGQVRFHAAHCNMGRWNSITPLESAGDARDAVLHGWDPAPGGRSAGPTPSRSRGLSGPRARETARGQGWQVAAEGLADHLGKFETASGMKS